MKPISEAFRVFDSPEWTMLLGSLDMLLNIRLYYGDNIFEIECNAKCPMRMKQETIAGEGEASCTCGAYQIRRILNTILEGKKAASGGQSTL